MKRALFLLILISIMVPVAHAKDIILSLDQKEYYFKIGEDAIINLNSDNSYKENINGLLTYTITQSINQGNFQYSSTNTQSKSFLLEKGKTNIPLNFGTSDTPMTLSVKLKFSYTKDEAREVILDDIKIHFVSDESQKNNQQNQISSSSQKASQFVQQQQDPFAQQEQRMQQMINQMFGNQQQIQSQDPQKRLQNNQMSQDSNALKQQIQNQLQHKQRMQKEFQKELGKNQEFMKEHQKLLQQGYNLTGGSLNPESNNTGSFELNYENEEGEQAQLKGELDKGNLKNFIKDTPQSRQKMLEELQKNPEFQKYNEELKKEGFNQQNTQYTIEQNNSLMNINYINNKNQTATIKAEFVNNTVEKVELVKSNKKKRFYLWFIPILLVCGLLYYLYTKYFKKNKLEEEIKKKEVEKPFDYKKEAKRLLNKSRQLFEKKKYKDAYGTAAQSLRLYLSYENGLQKELTNDDLIKYLKEHKKNYKEIKECFDFCSLVEFAKYQPNKKDFEKIVRIVEKRIN